ncbi:hypothetical protein [Pseudomonas synxantha]|uniref:Uncharacterized protein n=1 Tax=Pseudomonas synxantha TaxID=47883 RepID=A0ACC6JME9_9PSED|nr:hypothetical protein [Pseudomonas synxantha]MDR6607535.1 hypothetical protein [Pseudomonas synxantha]
MAGNRNSGVMGAAPMYICHGAEHDFKFEAVTDSPWINQGLSLNLVSGETASISTEPEFGKYQKLLADGTEWKLKCPDEGTDIDFNLQVQSEFTAAPYPLPFKLGDYRREILNTRDPISAPVVGDEVSAEIQVGSFYTRKELAGTDVVWYVDGDMVETVPTTDVGWSKFDHTVTSEGEHTITAKVHSPYDDTTSEHTFTLNVYLESPWEQATLLVNGARVAWNSPNVFLFRGQPNDVTVEAPFLEGKGVYLGLINQEDLIIEASPTFDEWVSTPDAKASWALTASGAKSGRITLKLTSSAVVQPLEVPCAVLSANLADEADVEIGGVAVPTEGNWFIRDQAQTVTLIPKSGSPLAGLPVTLTCTIKDGLDVANVVSEPAFGSEQTSYSWAVTGTTKSGTFQLLLAGKGMTTPITVAVSNLVSSNLADEAEVKIGGVAVPTEGNWFIRDKAQTVTLIPKSGSPLAGLPITLACTIKSGLDVANVVSAPAFGSEQTSYSWAVTGKTKSGTFQLSLAGKGMTMPITVVISKLVSSNLADEVEVKIGGQSVPSGGSVFFRGQAKDVELIPKSGSPIAGYPIALARTATSPLLPTDLNSAPAFEAPQTTHKWRVTGANTKSGIFQLQLTALGMTTINVTANKLLSSNLADEVEVKIGGVAVPAGGNWFVRDKSQTVTLTPKSGSPLAGLPVTLTCAIKSGLDVANVVSAPAFGSEQTTYSWSVTGKTKSGTFQLSLAGKGMTTPINLAISKLVSSNLADEADVSIDGLPVPGEGTWFVRNESRTVDLIFKPGSPLNGLPVSLHCALKSGLDEDNVVSEPEFGSEQTTHRWSVTGNTKSGIFQLLLNGHGMSEPIILPVSRLILSDLTEEVTVLLNGNAMPLRGANFIGGQANVITLDYKNAELLVGAPLAIDVIPQSGLVTSDFTCEPSLRQLTTTHEWKLTGKQLQSGTFKLKLFSEGEKVSLLTPTNRLSREVFRFLDLANYDLRLPPEEVRLSRNIYYVFMARLLKSDGSPSTSVLVTFTAPEHETFKTETGADGVARSKAYRFTTPDLYLIKAEAELPAGVTPLELLVRVT